MLHHNNRVILFEISSFDTAHILIEELHIIYLIYREYERTVCFINT